MLAPTGTIAVIRNGRAVNARFTAREKETFWAVPGEGIVKGALTVRGTVPGMDGDAFVEAAKRANVKLS